MRNRNILMHWYDLAKQRKTFFVMFGLVLGTALALTIVANPSTVHAAGGIGSGGSGADPNPLEIEWAHTDHGWAWASYNTSGSGPRDGFRDGTPWSTVQSTCQNANSNKVYIHVILDGLGKAMGYNYWATQEGPPPWGYKIPANTVFDGGRATAISTSTAQAAFTSIANPPYSVTNADEFGFGWHNTYPTKPYRYVSWFCYDYEDPNEDPIGAFDSASCKEVRGWAIDKDTLATAVKVQLYVDGVYKSEHTANTYRSDVGAAHPGAGNNHGFVINVSDYAYLTSSMSKNITIYAVDTEDPSVKVNLGTKSIGNCLVSVVDSNTCDSIGGWIVHRGKNTSSMNYYFTTTLRNGTEERINSTNLVANGARSDVRDAAWVFAPPYSKDPGGFNRFGFTVAESYLDPYDDAYGRTYKLYIDDPSTSSDPYLLSTTNPTACAPPDCTVQSVVRGVVRNPEIGEIFRALFTIIYSPGDKGRPLTQPRALVRVDYDGSPTKYNPEQHDYPNIAPWLPDSPRHYFVTDYKVDVTGVYNMFGRIRISSVTPSNTYGDVDQPCDDPNDPKDNEVRVTYHPYLKVYGNDIRAGGKFEGGDCSAPLHNQTDSAGGTTFNTTTILGRTIFTNDGNQYFSGASVELAAFALAEIDQFYSAGQSNPHYNGGTHDATPQNGLTFANWPSGNFDGDSGSNAIGDQTTGYGGESGIWRCIPDYWSYRTSATHDDGSGTVTPGNVAAVRTAHHSSGFVTIKGATIDPGWTPPNFKRQTIFIEGNAYIENDIKYAGNGSTIGDIPMFTLVVKGDIYISPSVRKLDGLYIAQPADPNNPSSAGGKIYTCAKSNGTLYSASELYDVCGGASGNSLTVNGAFIAKRIKFLRTNGSVINATQPLKQLDFSYHTTAKSAGDSGKECLSVANNPGYDHGDWKDNYICVKPGQISHFELEWVYDGPIMPATAEVYGVAGALARNNTTMRSPGKICTPFFEPSETEVTFRNNYLCYRADRGIVLQFHYTSTGRPPESESNTCDVFDDANAGKWDGSSEDLHTWIDNALCQNRLPVVDYNEPSSSTNIAEVFNFSPEMYLARPAGFPLSGGPSVGSYDSIRTLPPLL